MLRAAPVAAGRAFRVSGGPREAIKRRAGVGNRARVDGQAEVGQIHDLPHDAGIGLDARHHEQEANMIVRILAAALFLAAPATAQPASESLEDVLDRLAGPNPRPSPFAPRISDADAEAIASAIDECLDDAAMDRRVQIRAVMNEDGTVRSAEIIYGEGMAAGEAALRAFTNPDCQPLPMPQRGWPDGAVYNFSVGDN